MDSDDVGERFGLRRQSIQRMSFAVPAEGMDGNDFSMISLLCTGHGGGTDLRWTTGLPGPESTDLELEIEIRARSRGESG